jgi:hypothetical protein
VGERDRDARDRRPHRRGDAFGLIGSGQRH